MRAPAALACLVGVLAAAPIRGAGGSTTDGAVTLTYGAIHWSGDPVAHLVGTEPNPATDILVETGWWYRAEGDTREYPLPPPDTESYYTGGQIEAEWSNLDGKDFHVRERVYLFDNEGPSGGFWSSLEVQNNHATARSFSVFHYLDVDVEGSQFGDSALALSPRHLTFTDGGAIVRYRAGWFAQHYMVRLPGQVRGLLNDGNVTELDDTQVPFGPADVGAAFQFGQTLTPSTWYALGQVSVSSRLPGDTIKGAWGDMPLYPSLLFRNLSLGSNGAAYFRRTARLQGLEVVSGATSRVFAGVDDFDGDGSNELVTRDGVTGETHIDDVLITGAATPPLNWKLSATGDFDYDGKADILWRNTTSQKLVAWLMNGTAKIGGLIPTPDQAAHANWEVVGAEDFNGDSWRDLLWYNQTSGNLVIWYMDATVHRITGSFTTPASVGNNNWRAVAVGDFGKGAGGVLNSPDIVWQNDTSGRLVVWHMNLAGARTSGTFTTPDTLGANKVVVGPR